MADLRLTAIALAVTLAFALGLVPTASAQTGSAGSVEIKLDREVKRSLTVDGISLTGTGGATVRGRDVRIPISSGAVGSAAQLVNRGALQLTFERRKGQRRSTVRLRGLRTVIAGGRGYVTVQLKGQQVTLARIGNVGEAPYDPLTGRVTVADSPVRFDRSTASILADRLGVKRLRSRLGALSVAADVTPAPAEQAEAQVRARPAAAVDIASAALTWRARPSWVDYLHAAGAQGGTRTSAGAIDGPAEVIPPSSDARVYESSFPFAEGWYDAASGTANVGFSGTVTFFKLIEPFNIDLDTSNPVIELGGPKPQMLATLNGRRNNSDQQNRRAVTVDLDQGAVTPVVTPGPGGTTTYSWTAIPGLVPDGAAVWPIAGYYQPGFSWGSVTVSLTVGP